MSRSSLCEEQDLPNNISIERAGMDRGNGNAHVSPTVLSRYRHVSHESNVFPYGKGPAFPRDAFYTTAVCGTWSGRARRSRWPVWSFMRSIFLWNTREIQSHAGSTDLFMAYTVRFVLCYVTENSLRMSVCR